MAIDVKEKIKEAAAELFKEYGYKDTTIQDIAKSVGVAAGTIYRYYESKDEIFQDIGRPYLKNITPSQDKRRKEIIDAALNLFGTKGFSRTNMEDISKALGMSKAMIYQYFNSKEELFIAMVKEASQMQKVWNMKLKQDRKCMEEELIEIGMGFLALYKDPLRVKLMRAIIAESPTFPEVGQLFYDEVIEKASILLGGFLKPYLSLDSNPLLPARLFLGSLWSFVITQEMIQVNGVKFDDESIVKEVVGCFLKGIIKPNHEG